MTDVLIRSSLLHPAARPLIDGLMREPDLRYGEISHPDGNRSEIMEYPEAVFFSPLGDFLPLQRDGQTITGRAFLSHDDETEELKRIWTHPSIRRQGLARRVVLAFEENAALLGYTRTYLSTGFRQRLTVTHSPGGKSSSVADFAMGLIIASTRNILAIDRFVRQSCRTGNSAVSVTAVRGLVGSDSASTVSVPSDARSRPRISALTATASSPVTPRDLSVGG
ncbi:GNAT family N-acetyltransferase [Rhizobium jaguaris]|uniref:GNAT family N-acetyltransferase n=1 Tax=Rhizobium jaguaris TaxID=1312183 RepID=UPI0013C48BA7|nr:GNAT family N-acetyltransferase [Rhizobium jaguaris]